MRAALLLCSLLLAGCAGAPDAPEARYAFGGRFEPGTTDAQRQEVFDAIRDAGGTGGHTDDLPISHFGAGNLRKADCARLEAWADGLAFVTVHVPCHPDPNAG